MDSNSPIAVVDTNQFDALSSPNADEGKSQEGIRSRFGKDDVKEQAYQAREMIKSKVFDLKEQGQKLRKGGEKERERQLVMGSGK